MNARRWDIFCRVVDNYGDAGVTWRLARQLAAEHGLDVTLWIDALAVLARIAPEIDRTRDDQREAGVRVRELTDPLPPRFEVPAAVIEAFGCKLPETYIDAMAARHPLPAWIVLEHLSAEPWVDSTHGLPSPHPQRALPRRFFFPGFTPSSGGLPRELGLLATRDAFRAGANAAASLWQRLGVPPASAEALTVSLFCYSNRAMPSLLDHWALGAQPVRVVVPEGVASADLDAWAGPSARRPGTALRRGQVTLVTLPFAAQDDFDRILWSCDVNFVRGEDSFVRAQWAARPFVWHAYRQSEGAHVAKLDAFLARFTTGLAPAVREATERFWRAWDTENVAALAPAWEAFRSAFPALGEHTERWCATLAQLPDLASALVKMARSEL